jgi:hypothetical protein
MKNSVRKWKCSDVPAKKLISAGGNINAAKPDIYRKSIDYPDLCHKRFLSVGPTLRMSYGVAGCMAEEGSIKTANAIYRF